MLKKDYDKLKKAKKAAAAIATACEGADDLAIVKPTIVQTTSNFDSGRIAVWSTAILIFLLILVV